MLLHVKSTQEFNDLIKKETVVVDFYADWCGPCKLLAPIYESVAEELQDLTFLKVNVDNLLDIASEYRISSIPTILVFKDGKILAHHVGYLERSQLIGLIKANI